MLRVKTVEEIRYQNLEFLVKNFMRNGDDQGKALTRMKEDAAGRGKDISRATLYQILTRKETAAGTVKNVGSDLARSIEDAMKLEHGWMDQDHEAVRLQENGVKLEAMQEVIAAFWNCDDDNRRLILESARQGYRNTLARRMRATTSN